MKARLLDRGQYESLLRQGSVEAMAKALKNLPHARILEKVLTGFDPTQPSRMIMLIDEVLWRELTETLITLRRFFSNRSLELLDVLFLRWDVYNLKTVLRGKRASAPVEEILATAFPVGILDAIAMAELARAPTVQAVAALLERWRLPLARPVRVGLNLMGEADSLQPLEYELDRFVCVHASRMVSDGDDNDQAVRDYLRFFTDKANLLTALRYVSERSAFSPLEAGRHFLKPGGRFNRTHYETVVSARDLRDGLARLVATPYGWLAEAVRGKEPISLPRVERELDWAAIDYAVGLSRPDPLGIGLMIAYVEQKINEVRNLRMIIRGKALGMRNEEIEEWLILEEGSG